ncbi:MAG: transglycosylase SLT domain-containing protein [Candidatus Aminicenantales bacterium]
MMKAKKWRPLLLSLSALVLWACSAGPKPAKTSEKPVVQQPSHESSSPPVIQPQKKEEEPKTIIPPEEKKTVGQETDLQEKTNGSEKDVTSVLLEKALNLYQEAKLARDKGDLDAAIKDLDEANLIILKLNIPPDSPLVQDKDNLRFLIAQRIQEIYASRRNPVNGNGKAFPLDENKYVTAEIKSFAGVERKDFEEAYKRSGLYKGWIQEEFRKAGLPEELCWLPMIESGFQPRALSRARALGMWQFIRTTGYRYGLNQDRFMDERMDPYKSTRAAIKYFDELHSFFGDWTTALAAYDCGEGAVQRVIATQNINYLDNFWDLFQRLPWETARYVPRLIAVICIIKDPAKYGMTLPEPYPPLKFETAKINRPMKLTALAKTIGLEVSELIYLNPELRLDSTPDRDYELKVPVGYADKTLQTIASVPKYVPPEYDTYVVRPGDTLGAIAQKYGTSAQAIIQVNGLRSSYLIYPGQQLKIPRRG